MASRTVHEQSLDGPAQHESTVTSPNYAAEAASRSRWQGMDGVCQLQEVRARTPPPSRPSSHASSDHPTRRASGCRQRSPRINDCVRYRQLIRSTSTGCEMHRIGSFKAPTSVTSTNGQCETCVGTYEHCNAKASIIFPSFWLPTSAHSSSASSLIIYSAVTLCLSPLSALAFM